MRMGDGPIDALPAGLDAYAGYVNVSGIGITYPEVVAIFPDAKHLPITTDGSVAECADVESGAMRSWAGYPVGYASASSIGFLIAGLGRPRKLWSAHYGVGPHICSSAVCAPDSPVGWQADGTQWTDHGGAWDESLLLDDFFDYQPGGETVKIIWACQGQPTYIQSGDLVWQTSNVADYIAAGFITIQVTTFDSQQIAKRALP